MNYTNLWAGSMSVVILQPVKPRQHPFKAVLILPLYSSQLYTFSNEEITEPASQWLFYFFCNGQGKQGVGKEYKGCVILVLYTFMPWIANPEPDPAQHPPGWETDCDHTCLVQQILSEGRMASSKTMWRPGASSPLPLLMTLSTYGAEAWPDDCRAFHGCCVLSCWSEPLSPMPWQCPEEMCWMKEQ